MINMNCSFSHSSEPPAGTRKVNPPMHLLLVCSAYADICKLLTSQRCSSTSTLYRLTDNAIKDSLSLLLFFFVYLTSSSFLVKYSQEQQLLDFYFGCCFLFFSFGAHEYLAGSDEGGKLPSKEKV